MSIAPEGASLDDSQQNLLSSVEAAKRQSVRAACERCRRRKIKCDADRPCGACRSNDVECVFLAKENETQQQATKRKYDALVASNDDFEELHEFIASNSDASVARRIFNRIRDRESAGSILRALKSEQSQGDSANDRTMRRKFTLHLVQSPGSSSEIIELAMDIRPSEMRMRMAAIDAWRSSLPALTTEWDLLKRGIHQAYEQRKLYQFADGQVGSSPSRDSWEHAHDTPPFRVPALPWTKLASNGAVSQLVSIFLIHFNPQFRYVEEDLFIRAMKSGEEGSKYCSPLLVNSICALASTHCDCEEIFAKPGDMLSRGEHFHQEALRLWYENEANASLTDLQGLVVLIMSAGYRGRDKLGSYLLSVAIQLNKNLPLPQSTEEHPAGNTRQSEWARARNCAASGLALTEISYNTSLMQPSAYTDADIDRLTRLHQQLPDSDEQWIGYPLIRTPVEYKNNVQYRARWDLIRLVRHMGHLFFGQERYMRRSELLEAAESLAAKFQAWKESLPQQLQYSEIIPTPIYDLHGQYLCAVMALYTTLRKQTRQESSNVVGLESDKGDRSETSLLSKAVSYAYEAATLQRDYREAYGSKITPPYVIQTAQLASFVFLEHMSLTPQPPQPKSAALSSAVGESDAITDMGSAFDECFRMLIGCSLQYMLSRGITRMLLHTATELHVRLPDSVTQILQVVADMAWQPSDRLQISSAYPNIAIANGSMDSSVRMEELLRRWEALEV